MSDTDPIPEVTVDARRLLCPLPILRAEAAMGDLAPGAVLAIWATDPGLVRDFPAWCQINGHQFLGIRTQGRELTGWAVKKGLAPADDTPSEGVVSPPVA